MSVLCCLLLQAAQAAQRLAVTNEAHEVKIAALYYAPCSVCLVTTCKDSNRSTLGMLFLPTSELCCI